MHLGCDWLSTRSAVAEAIFMNEFALYAMQAPPLNSHTRQGFTEIDYSSISEMYKRHILGIYVVHTYHYIQICKCSYISIDLLIVFIYHWKSDVEQVVRMVNGPQFKERHWIAVILITCVLR